MHTRNPTATKRQVNEMMRASLRLRAESERIAFFCECPDAGCYQAVWLTILEYERARADPSWVALVAEHGANGRTPAPTRERPESVARP